MRASLIHHTFPLFQSLFTTSLMVCVPGVVADLEVHNIVTRYLTLIRKGRFMTLITVLFPSFTRNGPLLVHSPHVNRGGKRMMVMALNRIILILTKILLSSIISSRGILWNEVMIIVPWQRIIIPINVPGEANEAKGFLYWNLIPHLLGLERGVPPDITRMHQLCLRVPLLVIMPLWYHSMLPCYQVVLLQWKTYLIMGERRRRKSGVVFVGSRVIGVE